MMPVAIEEAAVFEDPRVDGAARRTA
jgi:hypothetical protein